MKLKTIADAINEMSDRLSKSICEINYFNPKDISTIIKIGVSTDIEQYINSISNELKEKRDLMADQYNSAQTPLWKKKKLQNKLLENKSLVKKSNILIADLRKNNEYENLKSYLRENGHSYILEQFYEEKNKTTTP